MKKILLLNLLIAISALAADEEGTATNNTPSNTSTTQDNIVYQWVCTPANLQNNQQNVSLVCQWQPIQADGQDI
jgi:hypothetical protein